MLFNKIVKEIYAVDRNGLIGRSDGTIPWWGLVPTDVARFKELTTKNGEDSVIYGRKTWDSLPEKFRPLPGRENVVLTTNIEFRPSSDITVAHSLPEAVRRAHSETVWIIGGADILRQAYSFADELHVTVVHGEFIGDVVFDLPINERVWKVASKMNFSSPPDKICYSYLVYRHNK